MLAEASFDLTEAAFNRGNDKADEKLLVQFGMHPHPDRVETEKEGRPIFKEITYITIMVPGEKETIIHRPAWEKDYQRFPRQYQAFKNKQSQHTAAGTPLKMVGFLTGSQIKELEYFNCYTVEQLANLPDSNASKFMGIQKLKQLANDYLTAAKETAPLTAMRAEMDRKDSDLQAAKNAIEEQGSRIKALEAALLANAEREKGKK